MPLAWSITAGLQRPAQLGGVGAGGRGACGGAQRGFDGRDVEINQGGVEPAIAVGVLPVEVHSARVLGIHDQRGREVAGHTGGGGALGESGPPFAGVFDVHADDLTGLGRFETGTVAGLVLVEVDVVHQPVGAGCRLGRAATQQRHAGHVDPGYDLDRLAAHQSQRRLQRAVVVQRCGQRLQRMCDVVQLLVDRRRLATRS